MFSQLEIDVKDAPISDAKELSPSLALDETAQTEFTIPDSEITTEAVSAKFKLNVLEWLFHY